MDCLTIKGNQVQAESPEGQKANLAVEDWLKKLIPRRMDTGDIVLPDGVKSVLSQRHITIWVHQTPPRIWQFKWIAADSAAKYGRGTKYRMVKLALPYLVVLGVFAPQPENGQVGISAFNECFFRNEPLDGLDDELFYPALLNCSKFHVQEGNPLSWICTQNLDRKPFLNEPDQNRRMRAGFKALMHCLLETGFNFSSEHHEQSSWFTLSAGVDPRVASVEAWQAATEKDPLFVLDLPWLRTGHTVLQVCERIFKNKGAYKPLYSTSADLARLVYNGQVR